MFEKVVGLQTMMTIPTWPDSFPSGGARAGEHACMLCNYIYWYRLPATRPLHPWRACMHASLTLSVHCLRYTCVYAHNWCRHPYIFMSTCAGTTSSMRCTRARTRVKHMLCSQTRSSISSSPIQSWDLVNFLSFLMWCLPHCVPPLALQQPSLPRM